MKKGLGKPIACNIYFALSGDLSKILFPFSRNHFRSIKSYHFFLKKNKISSDRLSLLKSLKSLMQDYALKVLKGNLKVNFLLKFLFI